MQPPGARTPLMRSALGLRRVKLVESLSNEELDQLAALCNWRRYPARQRVISRDSHERDVYLIIAGKVRVTSFSASGRQVTYRDIPAGDWFGDYAAIDGLARSADIITLEDTVVATLPPSTFRKILREHPTACDQVLMRLVTSVRNLTERVFDISTLGVLNRLHAELLRLAKNSGISDNVARITPAPRHSEISSQISTYREQVTRELSAMAKQGLIRKDGSSLIILDVERLERLVADVRRTG